MKNIICTLLVSGMLLSGVYAGAREMTVEQAVEYALSNSYEFAKKDAEIQAGKYTSYDAHNAYKSLKKNPLLEVKSFDTYLVLQAYYKDAAKLSLTVSERAEADLVVSVSNSVKGDFYTYLNSLRSVELAEENLSVLAENLEAAKVRHNIGTLSALDLQSFELGVKSAELSLSSAKRTAEANLQKLKNTINYKEEEELTPIGSFKFQVKEPVAYETAKELCLNSNTCINLKDNLTLAGKRWYWAYRFYSQAENAYKVEKANYQKAEADYNINIDNIKLNLLNMYNSLLTLKEQIELSGEQVNHLKNTADAMYLRYEMGQVTANDYRQTQQEYFKARNDLNSLELSYYITNLNYESLFSMEDGANE